LPGQIPEFDLISERLSRATGWRIVAVPGLIPEEAFFSLLATRRFPVTEWIRNPDELDFIVEPDLFHDLFGHVPLLFVKSFADYMQAYGEGGLKAGRLGARELLARLYWYTVEFGLIHTKLGLRAYGAGILSSATELQRSISAVDAVRIAFDVERTLLTRYRIDTVQSTYMVIKSFDELFAATCPDLGPVYSRVRQRQSNGRDFIAGEVLPGDSRF
jgi:phenylalanine-4-hydroxylase